MQQLAEEMIREKALKLLRDEVPHGILVEVERMKRRKKMKGEPIYNIEATIYLSLIHIYTKCCKFPYTFSFCNNSNYYDSYFSNNSIL